MTTAARFLVTAGLIWMLARRIDFAAALATIARASAMLFLAALGALVLANLAVGWRWHRILRGFATSPGAAVLTRLVFVGLFFNNLLPTGVGGDAVRAWRCRRLGISLGTAVKSILLDRACGYFVLVALYAASLPGLLAVLPGRAARVSTTLLFAVAALALAALFAADRLPWPLRRLRLAAPLAELAREARRLSLEPRRSPMILGLSAVSIGLSILAFKLVGDAVGVHRSVAVWAMVMPPVSFVQLVPVSLAGWGVREAALVVALGAFGVAPEPALAASVMMGLALIATGLPGGLIWLLGWDVAAGRHPRAAGRPGHTAREPTD